MGEKFIPISEVPPTYDSNKIVKLYNPLTKVFHHDFKGKDIKVPKGLTDFTEPLAYFLAKHIAEAELQAPVQENELQLREIDPDGENWRKMVKAFQGVRPADVVARINELVLDPGNKKDAKRIKELQAA